MEDRNSAQRCRAWLLAFALAIASAAAEAGSFSEERCAPGIHDRCVAASSAHQERVEDFDSFSVSLHLLQKAAAVKVRAAGQLAGDANATVGANATVVNATLVPASVQLGRIKTAIANSDGSVLSPLYTAGPADWFWILPVLITVFGLIILTVYECVVVFTGYHLGDRCGRGPMQAGYLILSVLLDGNMSAILTVSYDLVTAMGKSAAMSGLMVTIIALASLLGVQLGRLLVKPWKQSFMRRHVVACTLLVALFDLSWVLLLFSDLVFIDQGFGNELFWALLICRICAGVCAGMASVPIAAMSIKATPYEDIGFLQSCAQACRTCGLFLGPLVASIGIVVDKRLVGRAPSVWEEGAIPISFFTCFYLFTAVFLSLFISHTMPAQQDRVPRAPPAQTTPRPPERELEVPQRQTVVLCTEGYNAERAFSLTAIELATVVIYEVEYNISTVDIGFLIGAMGVIAILFQLASAETLRHFPDWDLVSVIVFAVLGWVACAFLFNFGPWWQLLIADSFIYALSNSANGVADGLATKASIPDTFYSMENFMAIKLNVTSIGRFLAGPIVRMILVSVGRNGYATVQVLLVTFGLISISKIVRAARPQKE